MILNFLDVRSTKAKSPPPPPSPTRDKKRKTMKSPVISALKAALPPTWNTAAALSPSSTCCRGQRRGSPPCQPTRWTPTRSSSRTSRSASASRTRRRRRRMSRRWRQGAVAAAAKIEPEEIVSHPHRHRMSSRPRALSKRKKIRRRRRLSDGAVTPATYFPAAAFSCQSFESGFFRRRLDSPRLTGTFCRRRRHLC